MPPPALLPGSGTWARRSSRYWLRAAPIGEDVIGGRPSWQAMVSVRTSIVPPGPCPPLEDTPGASPAATAPQVTASIHDFAVSLPREPAQMTLPPS
jgi:hypothetical protein